MPATDLALLIDAALAGGQIALGHWRSDPDTVAKPDGSPVSAADIAVDTALRDSLTLARPSYGWLSEETPDMRDRLDRAHCFILDPIDGTRAFLDGRKSWAISIAVAEDGRVTAGVIHMPALGKTFLAAEGHGAHLNGRRIEASMRQDADGATVLSTKATYAARNWQGAVPDFDRHFRPSMAYRLALVAEGRFDAMMTLRPSWEWDIAAGAVIASEAGAKVTDRHGAPLAFNSRDRRSAGVIVANTGLHDTILGRLR